MRSSTPSRPLSQLINQNIARVVTSRASGVSEAECDFIYLGELFFTGKCVILVARVGFRYGRGFVKLGNKGRDKWFFCGFVFCFSERVVWLMTVFLDSVIEKEFGFVISADLKSTVKEVI